MSATDNIIYVDTSSSAVSLTLPVPTDGRTLRVKDSTGHAATHHLTILPNSTEKIDGASSYVINLNHGYADLTSDGTNWFIASNSVAAGIAALVDDPTPTLGGNLNVNGLAIISGGAEDPFAYTDTSTNAANSLVFLFTPYVNITLTGGQTNANQVMLSFSRIYSACKLDYVIYDPTSSNRRIGTLYIVINNTWNTTPSVQSIIDTGADTGDVGVTWSVTFGSNTVQLNYTTTSGDKTMSAWQLLYATQT